MFVQTLFQILFELIESHVGHMKKEEFNLLIYCLDYNVDSVTEGIIVIIA